MKDTLGTLLLALLLAACGARVQHEQSGVGPKPAAVTMPATTASEPTPCAGICLPTLIGKLSVPAQFQHLSVDSQRHRIYGEGSRIDTTNPETMRATPLPADGPVRVNPHSGRYALASYSGRLLLVLNADDTLYDWSYLPGGALAIGVDPASDTFYVTTRNSESLVVYDENARTQRAAIPLSFGTASEPIFDASSGDVFVNYYEPGLGYANLRFDASLDALSTAVNVLASNVERQLLYIMASDAGRLELRQSGNLTPIPSQLDTEAYWAAPDPLTDRLYVRTRSTVSAFAQDSEQLLGTLPDTGLIVGVGFEPGDETLYAVSFDEAANLTLLAFATR